MLHQSTAACPGHGRPRRPRRRRGRRGPGRVGVRRLRGHPDGGDPRDGARLDRLVAPDAGRRDGRAGHRAPRPRGRHGRARATGRTLVFGHGHALRALTARWLEQPVTTAATSASTPRPCRCSAGSARRRCSCAGTLDDAPQPVTTVWAMLHAGCPRCGPPADGGRLLGVSRARLRRRRCGARRRRRTTRSSHHLEHGRRLPDATFRGRSARAGRSPTSGWSCQTGRPARDGELRVGHQRAGRSGGRDGRLGGARHRSRCAGGAARRPRSARHRRGPARA